VNRDTRLADHASRFPFIKNLQVIQTMEKGQWQKLTMMV
jgi:hypothetical protein